MCKTVFPLLLAQQEITDSALGLVLPAAAVLVVLLVLGFLWLRRKKPAPPPEPELPRVDVNQLDPSGPAAEPPVLECQGVPVRVAAVIVAGAGRLAPAPAVEIIGQVLEEVVPGLGAVYHRDRPQVLTWPAQLSTRGFTQAVFANTPLPGDRGKGSVWCIAAGRCDYQGKQYLAALVLAAASANTMTHFTLEQPHQWQSLLRVRQG